MKSVRENIIDIKSLTMIDFDFFGDTRRQSPTHLHTTAEWQSKACMLDKYL